MKSLVTTLTVACLFTTVMADSYVAGVGTVNLDSANPLGVDPTDADISALTVDRDHRSRRRPGLGEDRPEAVADGVVGPIRRHCDSDGWRRSSGVGHFRISFARGPWRRLGHPYAFQ